MARPAHLILRVNKFISEAAGQMIISAKWNRPFLQVSRNVEALREYFIDISIYRVNGKCATYIIADGALRWSKP